MTCRNCVAPCTPVPSTQPWAVLACAQTEAQSGSGRGREGLAWRDRACFLAVAVLPATQPPGRPPLGARERELRDPTAAVRGFHSLCGPGTSSLSTWVCLLTESEFGCAQSLLMLRFALTESGVRRSGPPRFSLRRACPDLPWEVPSHREGLEGVSSMTSRCTRVGEPCETAEGS